MTNQKLVTTDGRSFQNPSREVVNGISFGILWEENVTRGTHEVISRFPWSIIIETGRPLLRDQRGETRVIAFFSIDRAIKFSSWEAYDAHRMSQENARIKIEIERYQQQVENLQSDLSDMMTAMCRIYDINNHGGHGSRVAITRILMKFANPCEKCKKLVCECDKNEDKPSGWLGD